MTNLIQTAPAVFQFQSQEVRVIVRDGEVWFAANDVCGVLNIANPRDAIARLDEDEKGVALTDTLGGVQSLNIINESGMYALVLRSRDAMKQGTVQHTFRKWITSEVLPSIRKTGSYSIQNKDYDLLAERVAELEDLVHILLQHRLATPKEQPLSDEDIHALTLQQWQANEDCKQFFLNIEILRVHHQLELNHSRDPEILAINLNQYMAVCDEFSLPNIRFPKLKKALKQNTLHLFLKSKTLRSNVLLDENGYGHALHCWLFRNRTGARRPRRHSPVLRG